MAKPSLLGFSLAGQHKLIANYTDTLTDSTVKDTHTEKNDVLLQTDTRGHMQSNLMLTLQGLQTQERQSAVRQ